MKIFRHEYYTLAVLTIVAVVNYIDRQSLAILQIPIKHDLHLSDGQLGALTGLSFAILYCTLALPIAWVADRQKRTFVVAGSLAVWSAMTAGTGFATGFALLVLFRMGVALGEAGCVPATHSLIADNFWPHQRATAISILSLSFPVGIMLGFISGGWLSETLGWRHAFIVLGLGGLCLVPLVLSLKEPVRGATDAAPTRAPAPSAKDALRVLWELRTFRHATWGCALVGYALYATLNWNAPFYNRVFNIPIKDLGGYLALISGVGGGIGVLLGGVAAARLGKIDSRWYMWVPAIAATAAVPFIFAQYFLDNARLSLALAFVPAILLNSFVPPLVATAQSLVPANQRAFTSAVLVLIVNIIGLGLGPYVTGAISDLLTSSFGMEQNSLRYAIPSATIVLLWGVAHLLRAAASLPEELKSAVLAREVADQKTMAMVSAKARSGQVEAI